MSELKPCPFCGGEAVINFNLHIFEGLPETYGVVCRDCNAQSDQSYKTEVEARAAWNRRVEDNKQTPKKPILIEGKRWVCPSCNITLQCHHTAYDYPPNKDSFCKFCGQAIDWED